MMTFEHLPSDYYLNYKFVNLARPYPNGISIEFLESIADFECSRFLKTKSLTPDSLGNSILRHQIYKNFYSNTDYNIFLRSNIYDFIEIIGNIFDIQELQIPFKLKNIDSIYLFLNEKTDEINGSKKIYYIIDSWGLEYKKIKNSNLIIFSSIELIYGIENINLCWCAIKSKTHSDLIQNHLMHSGPSCSSFSEIYSLIALRNHNLINAQNYNLAIEHKKMIEKFAFSQNKFQIEISDIYFCATLIDHRANEIYEFARKNYSLILSLDKGTKNIYIFFGKKNFKDELTILKEVLNNF